MVLVSLICDLEETIAACLDLCSTERLYLPGLGASVVAGPRACHSDQTKSGQPQGVDPTNLIFLKEPLVPVKALS